MPTLNLDIQTVPTYNSCTLSIQDLSTYPTNPPNVSAASIKIVANGIDVTLPFNVLSINTFNSTSLGLTQVGDELIPLPDGIYYLTYSVAPANENYVNKNIMRTDVIQEKFDNAFMKLDMMECDGAIKAQSKVTLSTINYFIQGSIAAANNSASVLANTLYMKANSMLDNFIKTNCGCTGTNYQVTY
jgi:hypothetical protein